MTNRARYVLGGVLATAIFLAFQFTYFNRFLPIEDGWFLEYAKQAESGKVMYRDFHVFIQPVYALIFEALAHFFGYALIVPRYYGLVERLLLVGASYLLFSQITTAYRAVFLTLFGMFVYVTNTTDVIYSYYQLAACLLFASAYCLILFYKTDRLSAVTIAGALSGMAFMTKHSVGALVPAALLSAIAAFGYAGLSSQRHRYSPALLFMVGATAPVVLIVGYLWYLGALAPYWVQVFGGATSKGSLSSVLLGFWDRMLSPRQFLLVALFAALFCWRAWRSHGPSGQDTTRPLWIGRSKRVLPIVGLVLLSIAGLTPQLISYSRDFGALDSIYVGTDFFTNVNRLAYVSMYCGAALVAYYLYRLAVRTLKTDDLPHVIVAVVSFAFMYGHGLSGVIEPHAAVLGAGLLAAFLLERRVPANDLKNAAVYGVIIFVVAFSAFGKSAWMYSWWGWDERIAWTATHKPSEPLLNGLHLNQEEIEVIEGITGAIREHSSPGEAIYVFPHIPIFYLLADRPHATFSAVHYFDVCPDALARSDAKIVADTAPAVIVYMEFPEDVWTLHEALFRGGMRSGQRDIRDIIERFKTTGRYQVVRTYVTSGYRYRIEVLARNGAS